MTLSDVAIRRPVFTAMMSVTLVVLGLLGLRRLGTDLYPDVSMPFVTVTTTYPGASPSDVEETVTRPIEDAVSSIAGIDKVFSSSREDVSLVFIEFELSVPLGEAVQNVRDKVGVAQGELPLGARAPVIAQYDVAAQPVLVFSAASGQDAIALREKLDDQVRPRLEQLEGVAAVRIVGGAEPEVSVDLSRDRLRAIGLDPEAVFRRVQGEHLDLPGGKFPAGDGEVGIRVRGEFQDVDALRHMPVAAAQDGSLMRLGDVALVRKGAKEPKTLVRTDGVDAVAVEVVKQAGANSAAVANEVKRLLPELQAELGFRAQVLVDQSEIIEANAHEVWVAIFFGGAMAVLIILLFLLDVRGTIISALALPTSVVGTLFVMYWMGFSLNQLTLLGLSLAIGLLIDDAVVVRESITRRLEAGDPPAVAASRGTQEIALAVMATTFTLVAVFVPVAFMQGITGQFFRQFGLTITVAVLISLFVAFTLDPMLSARFVRAHVPGQARREHALARRIRAGFDASDRVYARTLDWVLRHRGLTFAAAALLFLASLAVAPLLGSEFAPKEDRNQLIVNLEYPPGTSLATASRRSATLEARVRALPGVTAVYATIGYQEDPRQVRWRVNLVDKNARREGVESYKDWIRGVLAADERLATRAVSDPPMLEGIGDFPPVLMHVTGRDFTRLREEAERLVEAMRAVPALTDIQLKDSPGKPELQVEVDREEAARLGVPAGAVALQVRLATQGEVAGKLREGRRESEIRVRLTGDDRGSRDALDGMWISTPRGPVALAQLARLERSTSPAVIEHQRRERSISVWAQIAPGHDLGGAVQALRARVGARPLPAGYGYIWDGMQKEQAESQANMGMALLIAVVFIFIVLASQFESFIHPFTIMLSLPLAIVGAVLGLGLAGQTVNMGSLIGIILLMGLVTKNAILLVDGALQHLREGDDPETAVRRSGPRRLRPILMTSGAMILGMLPTALGKGMGSEFRAPMAIAVIGGVITSTMLTLWVVPVVFVWVEKVRRRGRRGPRAIAAADADASAPAPEAAVRDRAAGGV
ncbi:acriflavin resistance protein [Anaeromyxobacter dehalogenans 2CP-1]|uniref:Acriflavin resistance protein n=1 Tax=Anaeromyxobacter dehalogenans (strain ATCC BAA-258 / DSM 21875 / 2CP-1) TaxID=455488 RepID=B8JE55_ANAD2|nr:efflux RND transporter permease subunit [Anaeromyxobacter dehalogenans]ACL66120.1 acriflavin resistance protein [Anaeromyxobacter dehalogenans 2CP-1]